MSEKFVCEVYLEKMVGTEGGCLDYKQIGNLINLLTSVLGNCKTITEAGVLNKIARGLQYAPYKIGAWGRGKTADNEDWDWIF